MERRILRRGAKADILDIWKMQLENEVDKFAIIKKPGDR